ncbi:PIN domain-containing protein [Nanoarchaeota archaeon]
MAYLLDTSAWIEYLQGASSKFFERILKEEHCFTPTIVLAELADNMHRRKVRSEYEWKIIANFVMNETSIIPITREIATQAAIIKAKKRKKHKDISLADCLVIATAKEVGAQVLTSDHHILDEPNTTNIVSLNER